MQKILLLALLGIPLCSQSPDSSQQVSQPPPQVAQPEITTPSIPFNDPGIAGPLACVKKNLPRFKIQSIDFASKHSAPAPTVILRCHVVQDKTIEYWEFSLSKKANQAWRLKTAKCLDD